MEHAFVRITYPYDTLQQLVATWAQYCEKMAVVEHKGEKTQKIHVHILMYNMSRTWKQFKNIMERDFPSLGISGNEMISKVKAFKYHDGVPSLRYMLKGKYDLSYNKGYDEVQLKELKDSWKPEVEKQSKLQAQLERFATFVYDSGQMVYGDLDFYTCKRLACKFAYEEYNNTFPMPMAMNLVKSIVYSCKFDIGFQIPEDDKWHI